MADVAHPVGPVAPATRSAAEVANCFESLGGGAIAGDGWGFGCEFGFWQRHCGIEPLGLLRWASTAPDQLAQALTERFATIDDPDALTLRAGSAKHWSVVHSGYKFIWDHSGLIQSEITPEDGRIVFAKNLTFLKRKILDDLQDGRKYFIYRTYNGVLSTERLGRLCSAVNAYGKNTLVYVQVVDASHPPATAEVVHDGLIVAYIDAFVPQPPKLIWNNPGWEGVCRAVLRLRPPG